MTGALTRQGNLCTDMYSGKTMSGPRRKAASASWGETPQSETTLSTPWHWRLRLGLMGLCCVSHTVCGRFLGRPVQIHTNRSQGGSGKLLPSGFLHHLALASQAPWMSGGGWFPGALGIPVWRLAGLPGSSSDDSLVSSFTGDDFCLRLRALSAFPFPSNSIKSVRWSGGPYLTTFHI